MAVSENYLNFILDQLQELGEVTPKKMFGGVGLFHNGLMFGKIGSDKLYLKVGEANRIDFENYGMKPYYSKNKKKGMPYWEVPIAVIEDKMTLTRWAQTSFSIAEKSVL